MMKKGTIVSEILLLLRQKLQLGSDLEVCLFKSCLPLEEHDVIQEENGDYDCVFNPSKIPTNISDAARIGKSRDVTLTTHSNKDVSIAVFRTTQSNKDLSIAVFHSANML